MPAVSYPTAWNGYRVCTSVDRQTWTRVDTTFEDGVLTIAHKPEVRCSGTRSTHSHEQHLELLAECQLSDLAEIDRLGSTVDGRDLHRLTVGRPT